MIPNSSESNLQTALGFTWDIILTILTMLTVMGVLSQAVVGFLPRWYIFHSEQTHKYWQFPMKWNRNGIVISLQIPITVRTKQIIALYVWSWHYIKLGVNLAKTSWQDTVVSSIDIRQKVTQISDIIKNTFVTTHSRKHAMGVLPRHYPTCPIFFKFIFGSCHGWWRHLWNIKVIFNRWKFWITKRYRLV